LPRSHSFLRRNDKCERDERGTFQRNERRNERTNERTLSSRPPSSSLARRKNSPFLLGQEMQKTRRRERVRKGKGAARGGASVRQLNFSSFGTQLEDSGGSGDRPTMTGPRPARRGAATERRNGPFPRPPSPSPLPYSRRVLRPLIPTFTRRTSAIANESQLAEPEPAATRFCAAPPVSLGPPSLSFPPYFHVDPPALPSSFSCSPNLPNRATAQLEHPVILSFPCLSFLSPLPLITCFARVHAGHVEG
jgi:hypothetical protein